MKVRMTGQVSGARDGKSWPAPGETIEVSNEEGKSLCESGLAEPHDARGDDTETATKNEDVIVRVATSPTVESLPKDKSGVPIAPVEVNRGPVKKAAAEKPAKA